MMIKIDQLICGVLLTLLSPSHSDNTNEAIKRGAQSYMVYLVRMENTATESMDWLCGGVIISRSHILTAASCLVDVVQIFVVAEYNKHVSADQLNTDPCTRDRKKLIVQCFLPKSFYTTTEGWNNHDIGIGKVETPYDFTEDRYSSCTYKPIRVDVNYNTGLENANTDVLSFGWGHTDRDRTPHELIPNDEETLRGEYLRIVNTEQCAKKVNVEKEEDVIDLTHTICTMARSCDVFPDDPSLQDPSCYENEFTAVRRNNSQNNLSAGYKNISKPVTFLKPTHGNETRRQDICQNDHGGPLITWINNIPLVIGISSTNKFVKGFNCIPPNLFESTARNEWFIKCAIAEDPMTIKTCEEMKVNENVETGEQAREGVANGVPKMRQNMYQSQMQISQPKIPTVYYQQALPMMYQVVQNNMMPNQFVAGNIVPFANSVPIFYQPVPKLNYIIEQVTEESEAEVVSNIDEYHMPQNSNGQVQNIPLPDGSAMNLQIVVNQQNLKMTPKSNLNAQKKPFLFKITPLREHPNGTESIDDIKKSEKIANTTRTINKKYNKTEMMTTKTYDYASSATPYNNFFIENSTNITKYNYQIKMLL